MDNSLQDCTELPTGDVSDTEIVQDYKKLSKRNQANPKVRIKLQIMEALAPTNHFQKVVLLTFRDILYS
jgi:hypothetical protein